MSSWRRGWPSQRLLIVHAPILRRGTRVGRWVRHVTAEGEGERDRETERQRQLDRDRERETERDGETERKMEE
jgi:hypothetical protein